MKHYSHGTFRYGPLHQISLVGKVHEEVGGYFPDLLGRLEENPFLKRVSSKGVINDWRGRIFLTVRFIVSHFRRCLGVKCQSFKWIQDFQMTVPFCGCDQVNNWYQQLRLQKLRWNGKGTTISISNSFQRFINVFVFAGRVLMNCGICSTYRVYLRHVKQCSRTERRLMLIM